MSILRGKLKLFLFNFFCIRMIKAETVKAKIKQRKKSASDDYISCNF